MKQIALFLLLMISRGCGQKKDEMIQKFQFDGSPPAYGMVLPIPPYGDGHVFAPDTSSDSKQLLIELESKWLDLWPKILARIESQSTESEINVEFDSETFYATIQPLEPGVFMADEASAMVGIYPNQDAVPVWHCFLDDLEIKHFQPVY